MKNSLVQNASNAQGEKPCLKPTGSLSITFSGYYSCVLFFSFPSLLSVLHTEQWGQFTRVNVMQFQLYIQLIQNKMNNFHTTLMAESEEEPKNLLMRVKEESEKAGLRLSTKKTKIMASCPILHGK